MERPILIIISLLLSFLVLVLFSLPEYQEWQVLQAEITQKGAVLRHREAYLANLKTLGQRLENYEQALAKIEAAVPSGPELASLFDFLQKTASKSGLVLAKVDSFSVIPPKEPPQLGEAHLSFSFLGSYPAFKDFVLAIEKSARLIEVESVSFRSPEKAQAFDFNLAIKVYFASTRF